VSALSLHCCVFFSLRALALVSPSFQVSFFQPNVRKVFSLGAAALRFIYGPGFQGEYYHRQITGNMLVPLPGAKHGSELK